MPPKGLHAALQGLVGLQAHDDLLLLVQVAGLVVGQRGDGLGVDIQHAAELLL